MQEVNYLGIKFTEKSLSEEDTGELLKVFNKLAEKHDIKPVKKFADRKTAVRRTWDILQKFGATAKRGGKSNGERKIRQMRFNYVASGPVKSYRPDTLRSRFIDPLNSGGITFEQAMEVTKTFDRERPAATDKEKRRRAEKNVRTRTYEGLRLLHYYLNYSTKQDEQTGVIRIVPNR